MALVIFFGKTPHSTGDNPTAASDINIFAKIEGDPSIFKTLDILSGTFTWKKGD